MKKKKAFHYVWIVFVGLMVFAMIFFTIAPGFFAGGHGGY